MRDIATKITGGQLTAAEFNSTQVDLENAVTSSDQTLDPAGGPDTDSDQTGKAMSGYANAGWGYTDSGAANAHVVAIASNLKQPIKYYDNMIVGYVPANTNTSATVTTNVATLGAKNIKLVGGSNPAIGEISTTRALVLKYNNGAGYFEIVSGGYEPGIIQTVHTQTGAVATGTTTIPKDDTIPQNTEGDEYMTLAITPKSTSHKLLIEVLWNGAHSSTTSHLAVALFRDSIANALAVTWGGKSNSANLKVQTSLTHEMTAPTVSSTTFKIRAGCSSAGTTTFNGESGARRYGGVMASSIRITEIKP